MSDIIKRYDRNIVPSTKGVDVEIELLIQKVSDINEIQSSSKMDIMLSQIWHDPGLNFEVNIKYIKLIYKIILGRKRSSMFNKLVTITSNGGHNLDTKC